MLLFFLACWLMELVYGQGQCNNKDLLQCATFLGSKRFTELCKHGKVQDAFTDKNDSKTLLLPSRVALDAIPPHIVEELNRNKSFLNETLFHHLVPEQIMCNDLSDNSLVGTNQGARVRFNTYRSDKNETMITVDGGEFENVMDVTKSGLICVIDKFLYEIPVMTAYTFLTDNRNHSTFLLLAAKAKILDRFKDMFCTHCGCRFCSSENFCGQCGTERLTTKKIDAAPTTCTKKDSQRLFNLPTCSKEKIDAAPTTCTKKDSQRLFNLPTCSKEKIDAAPTTCTKKDSQRLFNLSKAGQDSLRALQQVQAQAIHKKKKKEKPIIDTTVASLDTVEVVDVDLASVNTVEVVDVDLTCHTPRKKPLLSTSTPKKTVSSISIDSFESDDSFMDMDMSDCFQTPSSSVVKKSTNNKPPEPKGAPVSQGHQKDKVQDGEVRPPGALKLTGLAPKGDIELVGHQEPSGQIGPDDHPRNPDPDGMPGSPETSTPLSNPLSSSGNPPRQDEDLECSLPVIPLPALVTRSTSRQSKAQEQLTKKRTRKLVAKDYQPKFTKYDGKEIMVLNNRDDTIYSRFFDVTTSIKGLYNWIVWQSEDLPAQFELGCIEPCTRLNCAHRFPLNGTESRNVPIAGLPDTLQVIELNDDPESTLTCYDEVYFSSMDLE